MDSKKRGQKRRPRRKPEGSTPPPQQAPAIPAPTPPAAIQPPPPAEVLELLQHLEELRDSRVITFFSNPGTLVRMDVVPQIHGQLQRIGHVPRLDLFIHSTGGQTEVPWRIITLIRDFCESFGILIPYRAHSAATHLAMGADEIVMGAMSELSPVDPKRTHPLLPRGDDGSLLAISVQDLRHCMEFLKKEGAEYSPEALAAIYVALFDKIHPLALGAIEQSYALSRLISEKALSTHMNPETEREEIDRIVKAFSDEFFSHNYAIGWKEAQEIGLKVTHVDMNDKLWEAMWRLYRHYEAYTAVARPIEGQPAMMARPIVWIDSTIQRRILEETYLREEDRPGVQRLKPVSSKWLAEDWQSDVEEEKTPVISTAEE